MNELAKGLLYENFALGYPDGKYSEVDLSLFFTQQIGENVSVSAGKFSGLDLMASTPLAGGGGLNTFWWPNHSVTTQRCFARWAERPKLLRWKHAPTPSEKPPPMAIECAESGPASIIGPSNPRAVRLLGLKERVPS